MPGPLKIALAGLSDREAITDALFRCVNAFDNADDALLESSFTKDGKFTMAGNTTQGLDVIKEAVYNRVSKMDTTHLVTNIRIDVEDGATTATGSATAVAYHYRPGTGCEPGAPRFVSGSQYYMDFVKLESGLWKACEWELKLIWTEGDYSVMMG
ncbi:hypothetical protein K431DRAFT_283442 [Polychaeton citri CBS 116435]|uniref:SnoaL-like domain-containing protein n=1 Tax=Polychaeton citri CBS 116435 TaxID=1314669 RepID=A0A9P4QDK0_9PEZI|nr:hypothetical protein K431DRAFT_283442 [Polychaeton citri CBS 116435]